LNQIQKGSVKSDKIIQEVSEFYNLTPLDLKSASRKKELVMSRQIAMYLLREDLNLSFPAIGKIIGGRDHSTTMHGWEKVKKEVEEGGETKQDIDSIRQRIYTHK
jgi:chromosomal replication initiator protein